MRRAAIARSQIARRGDARGEPVDAWLDRAVPLAARGAAKSRVGDAGSDPAPIVEGCFASLGRVLASVAHFPQISRENVSKWIVYEGFSHYEQALTRGRGVLFATGHLGNWELSAFAHALMTAPMSFVVRPLDNPLLDALSMHYRGLSGNRVSWGAASSCAPGRLRSATTAQRASLLTRT